jgi:hypothetical protein
MHGTPAYLRFDNGGEFVAHAVADWARFNTVDSIFIDPGSPWQNAWIESFNGRLRDELLNMWRFDSLLEARVIIEDHRIDYNLNRPHTAHGVPRPAEFAPSGTTTINPKSHSNWINDRVPFTLQPHKCAFMPVCWAPSLSALGLSPSSTPHADERLGATGLAGLRGRMRKPAEELRRPSSLAGWVCCTCR